MIQAHQQRKQQGFTGAMITGALCTIALMALIYVWSVQKAEKMPRMFGVATIVVKDGLLSNRSVCAIEYSIKEGWVRFVDTNSTQYQKPMDEIVNIEDKDCSSVIESP